MHDRVIQGCILQAMSSLSRLATGLLACAAVGFMRIATPSPYTLLANSQHQGNGKEYLRHAIDVEVSENSVSNGGRGRGQGCKEHRLGLHRNRCSEVDRGSSKIDVLVRKSRSSNITHEQRQLVTGTQRRGEFKWCKRTKVSTSDCEGMEGAAERRKERGKLIYEVLGMSKGKERNSRIGALVDLDAGAILGRCEYPEPPLH
jgi:hypothetical protein